MEARAFTHRHYKGGLYRLIGAARHTERDEELTVYADAAGDLWARPKAMFDESLPDGRARFERLPSPPPSPDQADCDWTLTARGRRVAEGRSTVVRPPGSPAESLPEPPPASSPDDLRAIGFRVQAHHDYRDISGIPRTFWRLERGGKIVIGTGANDADALNTCRDHVGLPIRPDDGGTPWPLSEAAE